MASLAPVAVGGRPVFPIILVVLIVVGLLLAFGGLSALSKRQNRRNAEYVAASIERHLRGEEGPWEWDDFTSVPIKDNHLDAIRLRCIELDQANPARRDAELGRIVADLRRGRGH